MIGSDYSVIVSDDFDRQECGRIASSLDSSPKVIGSDYLVNVSGDFGRQECGRIVSSLDFKSKSDQRLSPSCCGLQVIVDDDVTNRKIRV